LRCFDDGQPGEVAEFDQPRCLRVFCYQSGQRRIESDEIVSRVSSRDREGFQVNPHPPTAVLLLLLTAGGIDQNSTHSLGRGGKKVPAAIPVLVIAPPDQPEVRLMNQRCRLEGMLGRLRSHASGSELAQLVVNEREQFRGGLAVPGRGSIN